MLWNVVFEFYVKYIFGGVINGVGYDTIIGTGYVGGYGEEFYLSNIPSLKITSIYANTEFVIPYGNYFSLIATIITMVAIVLICCALIKKIYNMCAHIIG